MNPDADITLKNEAENALSSKDAFLEKLGLDERSLLDASENLPASSNASEKEEDLVLSSLPDDLGISGPGSSSAPQRGFNLSASIKIQRPKAETPDLSDENESDREVAKESPRGTSAETDAGSRDAGDEEETLPLHCPSCRGALVLKRRHLGVEGACVWCHIPLVAAEVAGEGRVRVFPLLAAGATPVLPGSSATADVPVDSTDPSMAAAEPECQASPEPAAAVTLSGGEVKNDWSPDTPDTPAAVGAECFSGFSAIVPEASPLPGTGVSATAPLLSPTPAPEAPMPEEVSEIVMPGFSGFAPPESESAMASEPDPGPALMPSGFSGGFVSAAPNAGSGPAPVNAGIEATAPSLTTPDLDELYSVGGFLGTPAPATAAEASEPAALPSTDPVGDPQDSSPSSGFAQGFAEPAPAEAFGGPTPWGPPTLAPAAPPATQAKPAAEAATIPSGFMSAGHPDDAPPSAIPDGFGPPPAASPGPEPAPSWEEAFGSPSPAPAPTGFGAIAGSADIVKASPSILNEPEPASPEKEQGVKPEATSNWMPAHKESDSLPSFTPPAHGFSTGSSELFGDAKDSPVLFGDSSFSAPMPWDDQSPDDAPTALDPIGLSEPKPGSSPDAGPMESPFGTPSASSNLFAPTPGEVLPPADPDVPDVPIDLVDSAPAATPGTEPAPAAKTPPSLPATARETPQVEHSPGFVKPKRKVRKGFLVLMVVIVGFAAGAALASFVLPIEEYVNAARAFMEEKFNQPSSQSQLSTLPSAIDAIPMEAPAAGTGPGAAPPVGQP